MKRLLLILFLCLTVSCNKPAPVMEPVIQHHQWSVLDITDPDYRTAEAVAYDSGPRQENELEDVQCPIPFENRVLNYTGTQCVFSSLEMLARWAECKELLDPNPLTSRPGCRSYSGPAHAASILRHYGVNFEDSYGNRQGGIELIKKAMEEGRGALIGVPGHAMVLIHYDDSANVVKWVDNSDRSLRVQTSTIDWFHRRWDSWVIVIYADPDIISYKMRTLANKIPIIDRNNSQGTYPKDYIPLPRIPDA